MDAGIEGQGDLATASVFIEAKKTLIVLIGDL